MKKFGLIGYPLSHSFSKRYFSGKFEREGIQGCQYELYPLPEIGDFPSLWEDAELLGVNVTIPHKQAVIPFLDRLDAQSAGRIGAVNVVKREADGSLVGYNSDYLGFRRSLEGFLPSPIPQGLCALVLGSGGASKAVCAALDDLGIGYKLVSRSATAEGLSYEQVTAEVLAAHLLVVNTTPLGMYPATEACPPLPYGAFGPQHYAYDLVYNPLQTQFMTLAALQGAHTANGLEMLQLQAEAAWEIWNSQEK